MHSNLNDNLKTIAKQCNGKYSEIQTQITLREKTQIKSFKFDPRQKFSKRKKYMGEPRALVVVIVTTMSKLPAIVRK